MAEEGASIIRTMRLETSVGPIQILFPRPMPMEDIEDFEAAVAILIRGLKRQAAQPIAETPNSVEGVNKETEGQ